MRTTSPSSGGALVKPLRGEIAAHLRFGMHAGRDAAIDLQHHRVADGQRAVRLLRREPIDLRHPVRFRAVRGRIPSAGNAARRPRARTRWPAARQATKRCGEARQRKGVGQADRGAGRAARARAPADWAMPLTAHLPKGSASGSSQRLAPPLALHLDLAEQNLAPALADVGEVSDARRFDRLVLQAEPAALGEVLRQ